MLSPDHANVETEATVNNATWDIKTQQYHGGQEWLSMDHFVEDFSVTTNGLGTPKKALEAAKEAMNLCHHYPPAHQEPAKRLLAEFLCGQDIQDDLHSRLLLGNGASELIDLTTRIAPTGPWKPGPFLYKEYERSARSLGRTILSAQDPQPAALTCIVNPNNPTGEYMPIQALKEYIERTISPHSTVMVDESMQLWVGADFRRDSLLSQGDWIRSLYETRGISVYIIHSWTKIWSCTGLRLGSIVCPSVEHALKLKQIQVPWSVNVPALHFLQHVTQDQDYLVETWHQTPKWRRHQIEQLQQLKPQDSEWEFMGHDFISWIWIDFKSNQTAHQAVVLAREAGVPVRPGTQGYHCTTCVRIAVREPRVFQVLLNAWKGLV